MKNLLGKFLYLLGMLGVNPMKPIRFLRSIPFYLRDRKVLLKQQEESQIVFPMGRWYPMLNDRFSESGSASGHYFYQDLLVAQKIFKNEPILHIDVGSRVDGFIAHVASYRKIEVLDIRDLTSSIKNVEFVQADLMKELNPSLINYSDSISCLHTLEHFGLGKYGDPIKYDGYLDGMDNIFQILKPGGKFYFSVPIGPQRIEFNAHRVFSMKYLIEILCSKYRVDSFSYVDDKGDLHEDISLKNSDKINNSFNCIYGCGIFELTKI